MIWITTPRVRIKNEKSLYRNFLESLKQFPPGCQTLVRLSRFCWWARHQGVLQPRAAQAMYRAQWLRSSLSTPQRAQRGHGACCAGAGSTHAALVPPLRRPCYRPEPSDLLPAQWIDDRGYIDVEFAPQAILSASRSTGPDLTPTILMFTLIAGASLIRQGATR
jgi:hypothetical protein